MFLAWDTMFQSLTCRKAGEEDLQEAFLRLTLVSFSSHPISLSPLLSIFSSSLLLLLSPSFSHLPWFFLCHHPLLVLCTTCRTAQEVQRANVNKSSTLLSPLLNLPANFYLFRLGELRRIKTFGRDYLVTSELQTMRRALMYSIFSWLESALLRGRYSKIIFILFSLLMISYSRMNDKHTKKQNIWEIN